MHATSSLDRGRAERRQPSGPAAAEPAAAATQALAFGLAEALAGLSEDDRDVFLLKEVGGLTYEEISAACACTVEAVRSRLFRTRVLLRKTLADGR